MITVAASKDPRLLELSVLEKLKELHQDELDVKVSFREDPTY